MPFRPRPRYLLWILAALLLSKIYVVREVVAALLVFVSMFAAIAICAVAVWGIQFAGLRLASWSEGWLRGLRAAGSRRALAYAEVPRKSPRGAPAP